ncbi:MAG TPA: DUF4124 domain-containing protein [Burkholderiales bacterium]|nr:DUF4124 domain-containing protein [Burkholderiales bacterium]
MNSRQAVRIAITSAWIALLACAATDVSAQAIFKLVDAGGRTTFTDHPDTAPAMQADAPRGAEAERPSTRISGISSRRVAAAVDANEAARRLQQARLKRSRGMAPLAGEKSRDGAPNARYWRRQEKLRILVDDAQRRLKVTGKPQLAAR